MSENLFRRIFSRKVDFVYDKKGFSLFPISLFLPSRRRLWLLLGMMLLSWVRLYEIQQQRRVVQSLYALPLYLCLMSHQSKALCSFAGFDDIVGFSLLCACQATRMTKRNCKVRKQIWFARCCMKPEQTSTSRMTCSTRCWAEVLVKYSLTNYMRFQLDRKSSNRHFLRPYANISQLNLANFLLKPCKYFENTLCSVTPAVNSHEWMNHGGNSIGKLWDTKISFSLSTIPSGRPRTSYRKQWWCWGELESVSHFQPNWWAVEKRSSREEMEKIVQHQNKYFPSYFVCHLLCHILRYTTHIFHIHFRRSLKNCDLVSII